ncbi:hypothetical protein AKJ09_09248 [Labilithrix luteola]|uniref:Uncharacterized protein n=1 Tax=Labilithrix luteola TaxID=1391654 RepID=A0A0K1QAY8_9BACT|nr:hypothetical protein AKJ09_09248 [Labilithrix luteola]
MCRLRERQTRRQRPTRNRRNREDGETRDAGNIRSLDSVIGHERCEPSCTARDYPSSASEIGGRFASRAAHARTENQGTSHIVRHDAMLERMRWPQRSSTESASLSSTSLISNQRRSFDIPLANRDRRPLPRLGRDGDASVFPAGARAAE